VLTLSLVGYRSATPLNISGTVYDKQRGSPLAGVAVQVEGTGKSVATDGKGRYAIQAEKGQFLVFEHMGYETKQVKVKEGDALDVWLEPVRMVLDEVVAAGYMAQAKREGALMGRVFMPQPANTESYQGFTENRFFNPLDDPLSTFAIDVDAASYSNFRRFINSGQLPPVDAVRIEELINYFEFDLKGPAGNEPVAIHTEL